MADEGDKGTRIVININIPPMGAIKRSLTRVRMCIASLPMMARSFVSQHPILICVVVVVGIQFVRFVIVDQSVRQVNLDTCLETRSEETHFSTDHSMTIDQRFSQQPSVSNMGFFEPKPEGIYLRVPMGAPLVPKSPTTDLTGENDPSVLEAAARQFNTVVSALRSMHDEEPVDPNYDNVKFFKDTPYFARHWDALKGVRSERQARRLMAEVDESDRDMKTIKCGGWPRVVASVAAGVVDPLMLALVFVLYRLGLWLGLWGAKSASELKARD
jgi:hypothetical protein